MKITIMINEFIQLPYKIWKNQSNQSFFYNDILYVLIGLKIIIYFVQKLAIK